MTPNFGNVSWFSNFLLYSSTNSIKNASFLHKRTKAELIGSLENCIFSKRRKHWPKSGSGGLVRACFQEYCSISHWEEENFQFFRLLFMSKMVCRRTPRTSANHSPLLVIGFDVEFRKKTVIENLNLYLKWISLPWVVSFTNSVPLISH